MQQRLQQSISFSDDTPFARCYILHAIPLLGYIRQHVPTREDAEDIVVETFIAVLEHKGASIFALQEQEQLAWLRRVAYYKCVDRHRHQTRRPVVPLEETSEYRFQEEEDVGPEQSALRNEEYAWLHQGMSRLPLHYQTVLRLRFANGLRHTEIGRLLKKSDGAIRVMLSRALNTLRELVQNQEGNLDA